jgi:hypothetical protein
MFIGRKTSRLFTDGLFPRLARRSDLGSSIFYKVYAPTMSKATKSLECLCNEPDLEGHFRSRYHADQSATLSNSRQILAAGYAIQFTKLAYVQLVLTKIDPTRTGACLRNRKLSLNPFICVTRQCLARLSQMLHAQFCTHHLLRATASYFLRSRCHYRIVPSTLSLIVMPHTYPCLGPK